MRSRQLASFHSFGPPWPAEAAEGPDGFVATPWGGGTVLVRLWGALPAAWLNAFAAGAEAHGLGIVRGCAEQQAHGRWIAQFLVAPPASADDAAAIDYLALARADGAASGVAPALESCYVDGSPDEGGSLFLEVQGRDGVGCLGVLRDKLAGLGLVPQEITLETQGRNVTGRFALREDGGRVPSDDARRALVDLLDGLTAGRIGAASAA